MHQAKERSASRSRRGQWGVGIALALGAALRLWDVDRLPGEIYGDISLLIGMIDAAVAGAWPPAFVLSAGPLYPHLVAPVVAVTGRSYVALKLLTGAFGLATVLATSRLAREAAGPREAVVAAFVAAVSSWLLVFSRLGNLQVLSPLLVAVVLVLAFAAERRSSSALWLVATAVSVLGFFCYPSTFVLPGLVLVLQVPSLLRRGFRGVAVLGASALIVVVAAVPWLTLLARAEGGALAGYVLGHAFAEGSLPPDALSVFLRNLASGLGMLHVRGDPVFRSNPPDRPHLDPLSGLCCLVGLVVLLRGERRPWGVRLIVAHLVLLMPSVLVLARPEEVPNASRSLGVAPIAYVWVTAGAVAIGDGVRRLAGARAGHAAVAILLMVITVWNARIYFVDYARSLPDGNVAFGREIAAAIDELPDDFQVILLGCCWGGWGQPEPNGVRYALRRPREVVHRSGIGCAMLRRLRPVLVFLDPRERDRIAALEGCLQAQATVKRVAGTSVYAAIESRRQHTDIP